MKGEIEGKEEGLFWNFCGERVNGRFCPGTPIYPGGTPEKLIRIQPPGIRFVFPRRTIRRNQAGERIETILFTRRNACKINGCGI